MPSIHNPTCGAHQVVNLDSLLTFPRLAGFSLFLIHSTSLKFLSLSLMIPRDNNSQYCLDLFAIFCKYSNSSNFLLYMQPLGVLTPTHEWNCSYLRKYSSLELLNNFQFFYMGISKSNLFLFCDLFLLSFVVKIKSYAQDYSLSLSLQVMKFAGVVIVHYKNLYPWNKFNTKKCKK